MPNFQVEFQNSRTNWEWQLGGLIANDDVGTATTGIFFDDEFVFPDITPKREFFSWTNFRILCGNNFEKIDLWAEEHSSPRQKDQLGRYHQSGNASSTYADYDTQSFVFKNSDRFYFWIAATNQDEAYEMTESIYDPRMSFAVSTSPDLSFSYNVNEIPDTLGWDPRITPSGTGDTAFLSSTTNKKQTARWIAGWDNACVNVKTNILTPSIPGQTQIAILDVFSSIEGIQGHWLGCKEDKYIYGKLLYSLEDHDFLSHRILNTTGFKSCQISIGALRYD